MFSLILCFLIFIVSCISIQFFKLLFRLFCWPLLFFYIDLEGRNLIFNSISGELKFSKNVYIWSWINTHSMTFVSNYELGNRAHLFLIFWSGSLTFPILYQFILEQWILSFRNAIFQGKTIFQTHFKYYLCLLYPPFFHEQLVLLFSCPLCFVSFLNS